jgi:hypothetical protein
MLTEHVRLAGFEQITVTRAGSMDYTGPRLWIHRVEMAVLGLIGLRRKAAAGDGVCTFVTAVAA